MVARVLKVAAASTVLLALFAVAAHAQEAATLEYKWTKGDTQRYKMTMEKSTKLSGAQQGEATESRYYIWRQEVKDVAPDGTATIETKYEIAGVRIVIPSMQMDFSYDPAKPEDEKRAASPLAFPYVALPGEALTFKVSKKGKVLEFDRPAYNKIEAKVSEQLKAVPKGAAHIDQAKALLGEMLSNQMETAFRPVPEKPIKTGGTWPRKVRQPDPQFGFLLSEYTYTLQGFEPVDGVDCARVTYAMTKNVEPPAAGATPPPSPAKLVTAKGSGGFDLTKAKGYLAKATSESSVDVEVTMPAPAAAAAGGSPAPPSTYTQHEEIRLAIVSLPPEAAPAAPAAEAPAAAPTAPAEGNK